MLDVIWFYICGRNLLNWKWKWFHELQYLWLFYHNSLKAIYKTINQTFPHHLMTVNIMCWIVGVKSKAKKKIFTFFVLLLILTYITQIFKIRNVNFLLPCTPHIDTDIKGLRHFQNTHPFHGIRVKVFFTLDLIKTCWAFPLLNISQPRNNTVVIAKTKFAVRQYYAHMSSPSSFGFSQLKSPQQVTCFVHALYIV